ncbi:MAG: hypothetical protein J6P72_01220 [Firmicutes bacterium]|nr:hypothetical protein [Bacillota bacterium]
MPKNGALTKEKFWSFIVNANNSGKIQQYNSAVRDLADLVNEMKEKTWYQARKEQLEELEDLLRSTFKEPGDGEDAPSSERLDQGAEKFAALQELLVLKDGGQTIYDMMVQSTKESEECSKAEARKIVEGYLTTIGEALGVTFDFKQIRAGKSLAEQEKLKEDERKRQEEERNRQANPQPQPAGQDGNQNQQDAPQNEGQGQNGGQENQPQPVQKQYFESDPQRPANANSFEHRVWELRHLKDYYQGPLEEREIPQHYAEKKEGLYLQYLTRSDDGFANIDMADTFGQSWYYTSTPAEIAYTMRHSNTVDYRQLAQRSHQLLAEKMLAMEGQEKNIDSFDQDEYIIATVKLFHELQRTATPSERGRSEYKKFVKATESLIRKAANLEKVQAAVNEYREQNPMPANTRPIRRRDIKFTTAELKRHWGEWIGEGRLRLPGVNQPVDERVGRQNILNLYNAFHALNTYYEEKNQPANAKKAKELYDHMTMLLSNPNMINSARMERQFMAAAEALSGLNAFFETTEGIEMLTDLPDAIASHEADDFKKLTPNVMKEALNYIDRTMKTGLTEELNNFSNMPAGALGLGLIDAYEDNEKPKAHLKAFITLLNEKKTANPGMEGLENLIQKADALDKSCEAAAKLELQDQLDKMDEVQKKAGEFDAAFETFKKANPGEKDFYKDFDKSWRGVKYHARAARYSDKNWEKYLEFHGKEFFDGREREYYAKALVAYQHKMEQPVPVFSRKRARKEAELMMKDPVYKYLIEKQPKRLKDLMVAEKYGEAALLVSQPFRTNDMNKLKEAYAGLETMYKVVLDKPAGNDPQAWKDFHRTLKEVVEGYQEGKSADELAAGLNRVCNAASRFYKGRKSDRKVGSKEARMVDQVMDTLSILSGVSDLGRAKVQAEFDRANEVRSRFYNRQSQVRIEDYGVRHAIEQKAANRMRDNEKRYQKTKKLQEINKDLFMANDVVDVDKLPVWNDKVDIVPLPENMIDDTIEGVRETLDVSDIKKSTGDYLDPNSDQYFGENTAPGFIKKCVAICSTPAYKKLKDPKDPSKGYKAVVAKDSFDRRAFSAKVNYHYARDLVKTKDQMMEEYKNGKGPEIFKGIYNDVQQVQMDLKNRNDEVIGEQKADEEQEMKNIFTKYGVDAPKKNEINIQNENVEQNREELIVQ